MLERTLGVPLFQEQLLRMAMIAANFTGGEAEELRRAMGFKRSKQRMLEIEDRLRAGMARNGITGEAQDRIVQSITSFALYGFPESHAASFALLAYASAYFKCHYLAAFTCALLNNQPMGFYSPAVLVKDAQRHGLRVLPVDVNVSEWDCTIESADEQHALRLGLRYMRGLRAGNRESHRRGTNLFRTWTNWPAASRNCAKTRSKSWPPPALWRISERRTAATRCGKRAAPDVPSGRCSKKFRKTRRKLRWIG